MKKTRKINCLLSGTLAILLFLPGTATSQSESIEIERSNETSITHNLGTSPLGAFFGVYIFDYTLIINKNSYGVIGGPIYARSSFGDVTGFASGGFYTYNFDYFKNDPAFVGAAVAYSQSEGTVKIGKEDQYDADFSAKVANLSVFYGHTYVWKSGFSMSWRLGLAIPVYWNYNWTNTARVPDDTFKDDTEFYETIGKVVGAVFGGSGWEIGWSF